MLLGPSSRRSARIGSPDGEIGGSLRRSLLSSTAGKSVELVSLVLLATLVPRLLGPEDYGRLAVVLNVVTMTALALTLGGPTLMTRFVPAAPVDERVDLARVLGRRLLATRMAAVALGGVVALAVAATTAMSMLDTAVAVSATALQVATTVLLLVALGLGGAGVWSARYPVTNLLLVVAVVALYPIAGGDGAVMGVVVASALAAALFASWTGLDALARPSSSPPLPDGALRFGALQGGGAALMQYSHRAGVLFVAVLAGSSVETGYAALATGLALGAIYAVLQAFTVSIPHLAEHTGDTDRIEAGETTLRRLASVATTVLVPTLLLGAVLLDAVVPVVFGDDFGDATAAFVPALAAVALAPLHSLSVQVASLRLRPEVALQSGLMAAAVFTVVAVAAVPTWEAVGATAASFAGTAAAVVVALVRLRSAATARLVVGGLGGAALVVIVGTLAVA